MDESDEEGEQSLFDVLQELGVSSVKRLARMRASAEMNELQTQGIKHLKVAQIQMYDDAVKKAKRTMKSMQKRETKKKARR